LVNFRKKGGKIMKSKRIQIICLVLCFSLLFSVSAFADVKYATFKYGSDWGNLDTTLWYAQSNSYISQCGYSSSQLLNATAPSVLSSMSGHDVWVFAGHGNPGVMIRPSTPYVYAVGGTNNIRNGISSGAFSNTVLWFMGCNQANYDSTYGRLASECISKASGAITVYAVNIAYGMGTGQLWQYYTWKQMATNDTVLSAEIWSAANLAGQSDLYGFDSGNVVSSSAYGGYN
jgi:hypothetical protein